MKKGRSLVAYFLWAVLIVGGGTYLVRSFFLKEKPAEHSNIELATVSFVKEGEVTFLKNGQPYKKIEVEIAENEAERAKGLMFRSSIPDSAGMLFIFERSEPQGFWMKNTSIPLDIIYVGSDKKIVSIAENTKPFSEESIPSMGNAQYVVEVNAGFTKRNNILSGDVISFQ